MKHKNLFLLRLMLQCAFAFVTIFSANAYAVCLDDYHPDVLTEFAKSKFVILGYSVGEHLISTPDDPQGVAAKIFTVKISKIYKGTPKRSIDIWSENTSSRFDLDGSGTYLLFIRQGSDGYYVDSCGNSGAVSEPSVITALDMLKNTKRK